MKGKLIKTTQELFENYFLKNENGHTIATTLFPIPIELEYLANSRGITLQKLSYDNCKVIERGYDLDELAEEFAKNHSIYPTSQDDTEYGFKHGFQKALELMGDKKFSESDVKAGIRRGYVERQKDEGVNVYFESYEEFIQSLQQTEWDVEIEMDEEKDFIFDPAMGISQGFYLDKPKLDANGCLILKKV